MAGTVKGRAYDNATRHARSADTRRRILAAARASLVERGYRATTVAAIARDAGVHVDTIYELIGRKPVLLRELVELAISGGDRPVAADERDYVQAMRAEPDPARKLAIYAGAMRAIQERMAPLFIALQDAAGTDDDARAVWHDINARRAGNMRRLVGELADAGGLRPDLSIELAADVVWASASADVYVLLVGQRGWTGQQYQEWLEDLWGRYLLPDRPPRRAHRRQP
jgi:AcrR family transcriptional regulator